MKTSFNEVEAMLSLKSVVGTICPQQVRAELEQELEQLEQAKKTIVNNMADMFQPTELEAQEFTSNAIARLTVINQLRLL
jgi:uncharacterized protein (UPF0335 family)